jgi:hypothetical protein
MHPAPNFYTLMCDLGFRLFEGDGRMIAFPLASWLIRVAGIIRNP